MSLIRTVAIGIFFTAVAFGRAEAPATPERSAAPLASLDVDGIRKAAEQALMAANPQSKREDFRFLYTYYRVEPGKLVSGDALVAMYLHLTPQSTTREELGSMVRLTHVRTQFTVEMDANGVLRGISSKPVEQTEVMEIPPKAAP